LNRRWRVSAGSAMLGVCCDFLRFHSLCWSCWSIPCGPTADEPVSLERPTSGLRATYRRVPKLNGMSDVQPAGGKAGATGGFLCVPSAEVEQGLAPVRRLRGLPERPGIYPEVDMVGVTSNVGPHGCALATAFAHAPRIGHPSVSSSLPPSQYRASTSHLPLLAYRERGRL
jgi:hypothetical protein